MKVLYVDNYRGFANEYIPLGDVNFLVGENSTGKTSILSLLYLLAFPPFWFTQNFNTGYFQLGTFSDIASFITKGRKIFKVGLLEFAPKPEQARCFLIAFMEDNGLPVAFQYDFYAHGAEVNIDFTKNHMRYKTQKKKVPLRGPGGLLDLFAGWTTRQRLTLRHKRFAEGAAYTRRHALMSAAMLVDTVSSAKHEIKPEPERLYLPLFAAELTWFAPIRSKPRRTYDEYRTEFDAEGAHTPYLIRKLLQDPKTKTTFQEFLSRFGKGSALFDAIETRNFGKAPTSPFALQVVLDGNSMNVKNVGYGVSQSLPLVVDLYQGRGSHWYAIQQPEIHLHPRAQAALGDILYRFAKDDDKKLLVETHSDYVIDRFRLNYRKRATKFQAQVLFFERTSKGNKVSSIEILKDGRYAAKQPQAFRDFFINEELRLLGIR